MYCSCQYTYSTGAMVGPLELGRGINPHVQIPWARPIIEGHSSFGGHGGYFTIVLIELPVTSGM
jgi:hypothetical protein